jgi:hypothetical protein
VAVAARTIIDASPACHTAGGKPPAVEPAANMDHSRRAVAIASEAVEGSAVAL